MPEDLGTQDSPGAASDGDDSAATDPGRRRFLIATIAAMGGGVTAAIGVPAVAFVTGSARFASEEKTWIRLGSVSSVVPGAAPTLIKSTIERRTGYLVEEQEISVYAATEDGREFLLLSNICTHLGCRVRWVDDQDGFFCPCHNAIFGQDGSVLEGPPPRPLDRFEFMVEDDQLFFKEV